MSTESAAAEAIPAQQLLRRELGVWSAAAIVVGSMIGSGIFRIPSVVATETGGAGAMMLVWAAGGLVALAGALTLAEVAALFPRAGGIYVYLHEAYGRLTAFVGGWLLLVIAPASIGAVALVFGEYLARLLPLTAVQARLAATAAVVLATAWNYRALRYAAVVQTASSSAKVLAILALVAGALVLGTRYPGVSPASVPLAPGGWSGFVLGLVTVLWAYNGWQDATYVAGEVRQPDRTLPRALIAGTALVTIVYLLTNAAYLAVLPLPAIAESPLVASDAAERVVGPTGDSLVAALVCLSTFGTMNGGMLAYPRLFYAMAADGLFFRRFAAVHPRFRTPHTAISLTAVLSVMYLWLQTFEQLIEVFVLGMLPFWALAVGSVMVLRKTRPDLPRPYRTPGYPWLPLVFVGSSVLVIASSLWQRPGPTLAGFGAIAAGVPLYLLWAGRRPGRGRP